MQGVRKVRPQKSKFKDSRIRCPVIVWFSYYFHDYLFSNFGFSQKKNIHTLSWWSSKSLLSTFFLASVDTSRAIVLAMLEIFKCPHLNVFLTFLFSFSHIVVSIWKCPCVHKKKVSSFSRLFLWFLFWSVKVLTQINVKNYNFSFLVNALALSFFVLTQFCSTF